MPYHILSKSTFLRGCQCHKSLWLYKHKYNAQSPQNKGTEAIMDRGHEVGLLAQNLFPNGVDASPVTHTQFEQSVANTQKYITEGHHVIYEAAFMHNGVLAAIDILAKKEGKWHAYEVKASTKVKDIFIQDTALQYHVINNNGIELEDISIIHINNKYVRQGALDIHKLFSIASVLEQVIELQDDTVRKIEELKMVVVLKEEPEIEMGKFCTKPYPCSFITYCEKQDPFYGMTPIDETVTIDICELNEYLSELEYPLYYMDFETYSIPIPEYDEHVPYRHIPFQYSIHLESKSSKLLEHHQFIAAVDSNPTRTFIESLLEHIGTEGSIIVYHKSFENSILNRLIEDFPEYKDRIEAVQERIIDLEIPFKKGYYTSSFFNGSSSIKSVLPALIPEMSYQELNITNGNDASAIYYNLRKEQDQQVIEQTMKDLFEYCKLDTLAMVKILHELKAIK